MKLIENQRIPSGFTKPIKYQKAGNCQGVVNEMKFVGWLEHLKSSRSKYGIRRGKTYLVTSKLNNIINWQSLQQNKLTGRLDNQT